MEQRTSKKILVVLTIVLLILFFICIGAIIGITIAKGMMDTSVPPIVENSQQETTVSKTEETEPEKWQEGIIKYQNKKYKFNNELKTYLFMGVDSTGTVAENLQEEKAAGQSDAMFLLVANPKTKELSVISVNRNTMTRIEAYSETGSSLGSYDLQICLQYAYGDGGHLSSARTVEAVSKLFYNVPIHGYLVLYMDGVPKANDAVGGVELEILETLEENGLTLTQGETKVLQGQEAYLYLRGRDVEAFDSASARLRRQEQYILSFFGKVKELSSSSPQEVVQLYDSISAYTITNTDVAGTITQLMDYEFDDSRLYTVPGETRPGESFEEYIIDSEKFYQMILEVFYEEVVS